MQLWLPSGVKQSSKDLLSQGWNGQHRGSICTHRLYISLTSIRSLPTPVIVDFVSQDNNSLITNHYFKFHDSLIFVLTAGAVLWIALHTPQHCSRSSISVQYTHNWTLSHLSGCKYIPAFLQPSKSLPSDSSGTCQFIQEASLYRNFTRTS